MKPDQLLYVAREMIKGRVGPKEAAALAAVAMCDGTAQAKDVARIADFTHEAASSMITVLKNKGLVAKVKNPSGWPFYILTASARKILTSTNQ